jgi:hypothetical protein
MLLLLFVIVVGMNAQIIGEWKNQLGSTMELVANDGLLSGWYTTAVVSPPSSLKGTYQESNDGILLAFNVQWLFKDNTSTLIRSVTSWTGKIYYSSPGRLQTTWLLLRDVKQEDQWESIVMNQDLFIKEEGMSL